MRSKIAGFLLVTSFALRVSAEETFPGGIQEAGGIPCTPTCLLCHTAIPGALSNLKQPFGLAVLANGVVRTDPSSMHTVVANLRKKMTDSDADGTIDVDELAAGTNPNLADPNAQLCGPLYGCGAHLARQPPAARVSVLWGLMGGLALTAFVVARRRSSRA